MKKKILKWGLMLTALGVLIGAGIGFYLFNMPHRDVQATTVDFQMNSKELVNEYLADAQSANDKYLEEEGDSKIIAVTGIVSSINEDMNGQKVVLLKEGNEDAGVSCTFTKNTNIEAEKLKPGDKITIKGVIRSGAGYDEDLEMYEDVIMDKCDVLTK